MFQVRIHGRGGQGVVTAAELLSVAAFDEGKYAQAFPSFGSERMGAPVVAYCRISDKELRTREPVLEPDAVIVQDSTLLAVIDVLDGLGDGGYVLVNSKTEAAGLRFQIGTKSRAPDRVVTVAATEIARRHVGKPIPNVPMLAAFASLTGVIGLEALSTAILERFPGPVGQTNLAAASEAFLAVSNRKNVTEAA